MPHSGVASCLQTAFRSFAFSGRLLHNRGLAGLPKRPPAACPRHVAGQRRLRGLPGRARRAFPNMVLGVGRIPKWFVTLASGTYSHGFGGYQGSTPWMSQSTNPVNQAVGNGIHVCVQQNRLPQDTERLDKPRVISQPCCYLAFSSLATRSTPLRGQSMVGWEQAAFVLKVNPQNAW